MKAVIYLTLLLTCTQLNASSVEELQTIVNSLYENYGDFRGQCPKVSIVDTEEMVAAYLPGTNEIKIEQKTIELCQSFGENYETAISFVLAHELSHSLQNHDHSETTSFFAYDSKESKTPKYLLSEQEREADLNGAFMVYLLGYDIKTIFPDIIDKVYEEYSLTDATLISYPPKIYRKSVAKKVIKQLDTLTFLYDLGTDLSLLGKHSDANACFNHIEKYYSGIELKNAQATNLLLKALNIGEETTDQYLYPIEVCLNTRMHKALKAGGVKDLNPLQLKERNELINLALGLLKECRDQNKFFVPVITNILVAYNMLGEYERALNEFDDLTKQLYLDDYDFPQVSLMRGISLLNNGDEKEGMTLLKRLEDTNDPRVSQLTSTNIMRYDLEHTTSENNAGVDKLPVAITSILTESKKVINEKILFIGNLEIGFLSLSRDDNLLSIRNESSTYNIKKGIQKISTTIKYTPVAYSEKGAIYSEQFIEGDMIWNNFSNKYSLILE